MVTIALNTLLGQKEIYDREYPGGQGTMPPRVLQAYQNLLSEIGAAGRRAQGMLPGFDIAPTSPSGQLAMFLGS